MAQDPTGTASLVVGEEHTAIAVGSGDVPVLATPWLVALCERASVATANHVLGPEETSVGVHVNIEHIAASVPGATIEATAEILTADGTRLVFSVTAHEGTRLVGCGTIVRVRVHRDRFTKGLRRS